MRHKVGPDIVESWMLGSSFLVEHWWHVIEWETILKQTLRGLDRSGYSRGFPISTFQTRPGDWVALQVFVGVFGDWRKTQNMQVKTPANLEPDLKILSTWRSPGQTSLLVGLYTLEVRQMGFHGVQHSCSLHQVPSKRRASQQDWLGRERSTEIYRQ